ncbi:MAG: RNA-binding S4 domain-containing protein [Pseudomonadota bacterium]
MSDGASLRLDKWLWQARFFKTRSLAAKVVQSGAVRINGTRASKPAAAVRPGDVLTFAQAKQIRVVEISALGTRRGPAPEAQTLYVDQSPPPVPKPVTAAAPDSAGRPTKKDRRALNDLRRFPS